jgi:superfamily I DNA/RNA helicase
MTTEHHIVGPPGTGKTTYVARQCRLAAEKHGSKGVLVTSLTKAAATEAGGRDTGLEPSQIGTLHAHCLRSIPGATIVKKEHYDEWNTAYPHLALADTKHSKQSTNLGPIDTGYGDSLREAVNLRRHRMAPREQWTREEKDFSEKWTEFKMDNEVMGFTDLIERACSEVPYAPGQPEVIFADEAQDLSALECHLLRRWAADAETLVLVGDPDQALYGWRGSDPNILSNATVPARLQKSWRVPSAIHATAADMIGRCSHRQDLSYEPMRQGGEVIRGGNYRDNRWLLEYIREGRDIMLLVSSEYMLSPVIKMLREEGIAYHNPYNQRWNPLSRGVVAQKVLSLTKPFTTWTVADLRNVASLLRSDPCFRRGAKRILADLDEEHDHELAREHKLLTATMTDALMSNVSNLDWCVENMTAEAQRTARYPLSIYRRGGAEALAAKPRVIAGTIHSVKGGECDTVVVWPDITRAAYEQSLERSWHGRDALYRTYYVAMTRAKERLIIGEHCSQLRVEM